MPNFVNKMEFRRTRRPATGPLSSVNPLLHPRLAAGSDVAVFKTAVCTDRNSTGQKRDAKFVSTSNDTRFLPVIGFSPGPRLPICEEN